MSKINVLNINGEKIKDITLSKEVFGIVPNDAVLYDAIKLSQNNARQGTRGVKGRSDVSGGGRKPWRQKGTGRARQGSINAPQWRHGGIVFGPTPRSYAVKVNRKVAQLAMKSALSSKVLEQKLVAVEKIELNEIKTKGFVEVLNNLGANTKVLVVLPEVTENVRRSSDNVANAFVNVQNHVSVYDILNCDKLVVALDSIKYFEEVLA